MLSFIEAIFVEGIRGLLPNSFWNGVLTIFVATIVVRAASALVTLVWRKIKIEHDMSMLAYLGTDHDMRHFARVPIFMDSPRFYQLSGHVYPANDPRDVVGFVVGETRYLRQSEFRNEPEGYYAFLIINWDWSERFTRWINQGYTLQRSAALTDGGDLDLSRSDNRHLVLAPFDEECKFIADIKDGWRDALRLRWQPYAKWGFRSDDLNQRTMTWQSRGLHATVRCLQLIRRAIMGRYRTMCQVGRRKP